MTLLTMAQAVARKVGLAVPTSVINSTDPNVARIQSFLEEEGQWLVDSFDWQALQTEKTFTAIAQELQTDIYPTDFKKFLRGTFYNRTRKRLVVGPLTPEEWQIQKSLTATVVVDAFRVMGNNIHVMPAPAAGDTMVFEYISTFWVDSGPTPNGTADATVFSDNADTVVFDENLMVLGAAWRFNANRSFEYGEIHRQYMVKLARAKKDDGGVRDMDLNNPAIRRELRPRVEEGSWNV